MLKKISIILVMLLLTMSVNAQPYNKEAFIGTWISADGSNSITVIKEAGLYYIIEFIRIKHELFFSGDNKRAQFQEWGKGPPGGTCGLELGDDNKTLIYYGISEFAEWVKSYVFYKKP